MTEGEPFVDHYAVLGVDWDCDARTLENAYRRLAKTYHPDYREAADVTKFNEVIAAYRCLRRRGGRAEYDIRYAAEMDCPTTASGAGDEGAIEERAALSDAEMHEKICGFSIAGDGKTRRCGRCPVHLARRARLL
jgi:curved DNA-binding protein